MNIWIAIVVFAVSMFFAIFSLAQPIYCLLAIPHLNLLRSRNLIPSGYVRKQYVLPIFIWLIINGIIVILVAVFTDYIIPLLVGFFIGFLKLIGRNARNAALLETFDNLEKAGIVSIDEIKTAFEKE